MKHCPNPYESDPLQLSPVLAFTVTEPVGVPAPLTLKLTKTEALTGDGLGEVPPIAVVLASWPVPLRLMVWVAVVAFSALSVNVAVLVMLPVACGAKLMLRVHLSPGA